MKKHAALIGIIALVSIVAGCANRDYNICTGPTTFCPGPSRLQMDYGTSYKLAKFNQVLDPAAEKNLEPVTGFDGEAARITIDKYQKDFEKPTPPPRYMLTIGSVRQ
jgi:hypothetical protein